MIGMARRFPVDLSQIKDGYAATVPWEPWGYRQDELTAVEARMGVAFPAAYRAFLLWNGREFAPWNGDDMAVDLVPELQEWALETLADGRHQLQLPADALVFKQHGGYEFDFFRLGEGDDPPVYDYSQPQAEADFRCLAPHFSVFVMDALAYYLERRNITIPSSQAFPPEGGAG
jgi:hypothetical protein